MTIWSLKGIASAMGIGRAETAAATPPPVAEAPIPMAVPEDRNVINIGGLENGAGKEAYDYSYQSYRPVFPVIYDGEKTQGNAGPIIRYLTDHYALRLRSAQLFKESEFVQAVIRKFKMWIIGEGLNLDCDPQETVLKLMGVNIDTEKFNDTIEAYWGLLSKSKMLDWAGQKSLYEMQDQACEESMIGGDTLVILRTKGNCAKVQLIDGYHVSTPPTAMSNGTDSILPNGNRVRNGVEIDDTGRHVAYHVKNGLFDWERIPAYGAKTGLRMAYLVYGLPGEIGDTRGYPLMAGAIETAHMESDMRNYALNGMKSRQGIAFTVEHDKHSDGEDPLSERKMKKVVPVQGASPKDQLGMDINGVAVATTVTALTGNTTINMPIGAQLKMHDSKQEINVPEFCMFHFKVMSAMVGMPVCVAMSEYNDSFSASRMAGEDWQHTFLTWRQRFSSQFMGPIHELQMYLWVNSNAVNAPGYMEFLITGNEMGKLAYLNCNWLGDNFPDIDPLKTVKYVREALGEDGKHIPLMTAEAASQIIGQKGEHNNVIKQYGKELEKVDGAGIMRQVERQAEATEDDDEKGEPDEKGVKPKGVK